VLRAEARRRGLRKAFATVARAKKIFSRKGADMPISDRFAQNCANARDRDASRDGCETHAHALARVLETDRADVARDVDRSATRVAAATTDTPLGALEFVARRVRESMQIEIRQAWTIAWCPIGGGSLGVRVASDSRRARANEARPRKHALLLIRLPRTGNGAAPPRSL